MQPPDPIASPKPLSRFAVFAPKPTTPVIAEHPSTPYTPAWWSKRFPGEQFVEMVNPSSSTVRALIYLGPPVKPATAPRSDDDEGDIDATPSAARRAWATAHNKSLFTLVEIAAGAREQIPRSLVACLVTTSPNGDTVIGGLAPQLRIVGDESPPSLHSSLGSDHHSGEIFAVPTASPRTAKK